VVDYRHNPQVGTGSQSAIEPNFLVPEEIARLKSNRIDKGVVDRLLDLAYFAAREEDLRHGSV
jgi:hypothetical protein